MSAEIADKLQAEAGGAGEDGPGWVLSDRTKRKGRAGRPRAGVPARSLGDTGKWDAARVGEVLLWMLLLFVPWPFGSVDAGSEWVVSLLVAGLGICLIKRVMFERERLEWNAALWPLMGLLVLGWMTTWPVPVSWVEAIAPRNVSLRREVLGHLSFGEERTTLAIYPHATRHMLRLMLGSGIVTLAVLNFCRTAGQVKRLLAAVAVSGGAVAAEALLQDATSNGLIYWTIPAPVKSTSGPFVNYNNFSQFMNMTIGAAMGLLMVVAWGKGGERRGRGEGEQSRHVGLLSIVIVMAGLSVLLSTSRGGVLAMLGAGVVTGLLLVVVRADGRVMRIMALAGVAIVFLLVGLGLENFMGRMATLSDLESASGMRWQVFQDVTAMVPQFGVWGVGLGNHEFVYPMFSHLGTWRNAQFVENEYLQLVEEMGGVGLVLGVAFLSGMAWNIGAILRQRKTEVAVAVVGLAYGVVAICMGSVTDFGQRLASVSTMTAVIFGLILAIRRLEKAELPEGPGKPKRWHSPAFSGVMLGVCLWMLWGSTHAAAAQEHWKRAVAMEKTLLQKNWQGNDEQYAKLIEEAGAAAAWEPGNAEYRCWWNIYRWHQGLRPAVWDGMSDPQRGKLFSELLAEFRQGEADCPTYGLNYAMAGQIAYLGLHDDNGIEEIRRAYRLAPTHPAVCFIAGRLDAAQGEWQAAGEAFRRALALHYPREEILAVYLKEQKRPDLAAEFFADDWQLLQAIEMSIARDPARADLAEAVRLKSQAVLFAEAKKPDASVQTLVAMADQMLRQGDSDEAINYYRRALDGNYGNVESHLGLARSLARKGDVAQAKAEADICLRLRPDLMAARQLLSDLSTPLTNPD